MQSREAAVKAVVWWLLLLCQGLPLSSYFLLLQELAVEDRRFLHPLVLKSFLYCYFRALLLLARLNILFLSDLCLEKEMQVWCGGDPSSWSLGCQHRPAESREGTGGGWWATRAVALPRAGVISSCSRNSGLACYVFLMYSLGQHHKGMSQEFVYDTSQRCFLLGFWVLRGNGMAFPCGNLLPQHMWPCAVRPAAVPGFWAGRAGWLF